MRSAIYYPGVEDLTETTAKSALLLLDDLKVIAPYEGFAAKPPEGLAEVWELIGGHLVPDRVQQGRAHEHILDLIASKLPNELFYRDDMAAPGFGPREYELWPQKLLPETWQALQDASLTREPLANGDYAFHEQAGYAVMATLAEACAGSTFGRWTDRFLAFGLVAERAPVDAKPNRVVPYSLSLIDAADIPLENLLAYRRREASDRSGADYTKLRRRYASRIDAHLESIRTVESPNELDQRRKEFQGDLRDDLRDLKAELRLGAGDFLMSPAVVGTVVAAGAWAATRNAEATFMAGLSSGGVGKAVEKLFEALNAKRGFSAKQRAIMAAHPMAYLYQLNRTR
ncbi:MAG TPA: hypothetical protein VFW13_15030 [Phenylobacterium sp.]|nr:hypothetical protein [Phenylobacterium sp.]